MYIHRDHKGEMKAEYSNATANRIINGVAGQFRNYKTASKSACTAYEIAGSSSMKISTNDESFKLFFWPGDLLIPSGV